MPEPHDRQTEADSANAESVTLVARLNRFRDWAMATKLRSVLVGLGLVMLVLATVGTWLYLATLTVQADVPTMAEALEAYDAGELEEARLRVVRITEAGGLSIDEHGGPLFVLGAVKAAEAQTQWSSSLRQSQFAIAAKYLKEARDIGFPSGRKRQGQYLLGRSLIESGKVREGMEVLDEALETPTENDLRLHLTMIAACLQADPPEYDKALTHVNQALDDDKLPANKRVTTQLDRVYVLSKLGRYSEAREVLDKLPADQVKPQRRLLAAVRVDVDQLRNQRSRQPDDAEPALQLSAEAQQRLDRLRATPAADEMAEEAMYLAGEAHMLLGETNDAIQTFERVRRLFASSPAGVAASIAEGDLYREEKRDYDRALTAYRRSLSFIENPRAYRNRLLPLGELRQRMLAAHADFVDNGEFVAAVSLVDQLAPLVGKQRQVELRATTLRDWGRQLVAEAIEPLGHADPTRREGRRHLREAGLGFERLAELQFATPQYTDAVWDSAECYLEGQSYTGAIKMLDEYLRNEPVERNAQALLRLGQAHLAQGNTAEGVFALEECIELNPQDAAVYRARLDCAMAFRDQGRATEAEQLLLANLNGSGQSPDSAEWRDSLFELGHLLHDAGRYIEAIDRLEEAVERYPESPQARSATYLIAQSHRHAAAAPLAELAAAKTANERASSTRKVQNHLLPALEHYEEVRVEIAGSEHTSPLDRAMLRNCYMFKGTVLFELGVVEKSPQRFKDAIDEYSNVSTLYQNEPFVLETFVQIANCQRRLQQPVKARLNIDQALQLLKQLPEDADFLASTNFTRNEWERMLTQMLEW